MTNIEDQLKNLKNVRLPKEASFRMREELMAYADLHSFTPKPKLSPLQFFSMRLYAGFAMLLLLIGGVGGTAFASEKTLPGDILYPVKVGFAEPIQTALIPDDTGKAAWHAILAERRLEEAAQLAAKNDLSAETQTKLAANFNQHVEASVSSAERLQSAGDTMGSLSVRSDLEARIAAHEQILGVIAGHYASATTTVTNGTNSSVKALLAIVQSHEQRLISSRIALEDRISPREDASASTATLAIATEPVNAKKAAPAMNAVSVSADAGVQNARMVRTQEVESILMNHATLLAKFLPQATTSPATTTEATTTVEANIDAQTNASTTQDEVNIEKPFYKTWRNSGR